MEAFTSYSSDLSSTPIAELPTVCELDCRARTLSAILSAINYTRPFAQVHPNPVLLPYTDVDPSWLDTTEDPKSPAATGDSDKADPNRNASPTLIRSMKRLNLMAQLLVRHHEIVAVVPKRSGPDGNFSMMVSCDPDSDASGDVADILSRNPRVTSPVPHDWPTPVTELLWVSTKQGLIAHLHKYTKVSFTTHVACVEYLVNRIIIAAKIKDNMDRYAPLQLLICYLTFRALPKMHRRFNCRQFTHFLASMRALTKEEVRQELHDLPQHTLSLSESTVLLTVLSYKEVNFKRFPNLLKQCRRTMQGKDGVCTAKTAFELHRLLLLTLDRTIACVNGLHLCSSSWEMTLEDFTQRLGDVERWMGVLNLLIHYGEVVPKHMKALEQAIQRQPVGEPEPAGDTDGNDDEMQLEIENAARCNRAGQQCLWLSVSLYYAIDSLTGASILPRYIISLSTWEEHWSERKESTRVHDWEHVIRGIFGSGVANITGDEAVATLREYGKKHNARTGILRCRTASSRPESGQKSYHFTGRWHAEALLATLKYQRISGGPGSRTFLLRKNNSDPANATNENATTTSNPNEYIPPTLRAFCNNTYSRIGVSKRCCLICTKLISLLFPDNPLTILAGHGSVYPTALPPYLPQNIAVDMVMWLEGLVRSEVGRLVGKSRRRRTAESAARGSDDLKGQSPDGQGGETGGAEVPPWLKTGLKMFEASTLSKGAAKADAVEDDKEWFRQSLGRI